MNIKRFGRYLAILIFLIWISGSWTSLTPAQSRAELIQETLEICAGKIKKYSWDWVVSPNNHRIIDLSSSGGCGGFQLVLYTNSRYWGEASIYDCPDHPSAANIFQNLTYPPKTWSASLPSVRSTEDYTSVNSKEGSLYIFDQFIEFIEDANYAAWEGSHDPDFRYKQWFTIYKSTLANNLLVYESMGPRTKTQSSLDSVLISCAVDNGLVDQKPTSSNQDPTITKISMLPSEPVSIDTIVFFVQAEDPDGDELKYTWDIDGETQSVNKPNPTWKNPSAGFHDISVTVSDGKGGSSSEFLSFYVADQVGSGDMDNDGFLDDEDLCKGEAGIFPDGCPPFAIDLGCQPIPAGIDEPLVCTASVVGGYDNETFEYNWYRDIKPVQSGENYTWTWSQPEQGTYEVVVQAVGDLRYQEASTQVVIGETAGGFMISQLNCSDGISSDDTLLCSAQLVRDDPNIGPLNVSWFINGVTAAFEISEGDTSALALDEPAPGDHIIEIKVTDPATNISQTDSIFSEVTPGQNALVPPIAQVGAAAGTLAAVGTWMWLEWLRAKREEDLDKTPRVIPEWVFDQRKLKDIWKADAAEEMKRRGLDGYYEEGEDRIIALELIAGLTPNELEKNRWGPYKQEQLKRKYWGQRDAITKLMNDNPHDKMWSDILDLIDKNFDNVFHDGKWDEIRLNNLNKAIERLGGMELGDRIGKDFTYEDAMRQTIGEVAQNPVIRVIAAVKTGGASEIFFQPLSTFHNMRKNVLEKGMSPDQAAREAYVETAKYAATTLICGVAAKGFSEAVPAFLDDVKPAAVRLKDWVAGQSPTLAKVGRAAASLGRGTVRVGKNVYDVLNTPITGKTAKNFLERAGSRVGSDQIDDALGRASSSTDDLAQRTGLDSTTDDLLDKRLKSSELMTRPREGLPTDPKGRQEWINKTLRDKKIKYRAKYTSQYRVDDKGNPVLGDTPIELGTPPEDALLRPDAFTRGRIEAQRTLGHETGHAMQRGQLQTQAAPGGPKSSYFNAAGKMYKKGAYYLELQQYTDDIDNLLKLRQNLLQKAASKPPNLEHLLDDIDDINNSLKNCDANYKGYLKSLTGRDMDYARSYPGRDPKLALQQAQEKANEILKKLGHEPQNIPLLDDNFNFTEVNIGDFEPD